MNFKLGRFVLTRGVNSLVGDDPTFSNFVTQSIRRHVQQNWGDLCDEDKEANDKALERFEGKLNGRLFSAYEGENQPKIWIITEWDESATTVLFPDEY